MSREYLITDDTNYTAATFLEFQTIINQLKLKTIVHNKTVTITMTDDIIATATIDWYFKEDIRIDLGGFSYYCPGRTAFNCVDSIFYIKNGWLTSNQTASTSGIYAINSKIITDIISTTTAIKIGNGTGSDTDDGFDNNIELDGGCSTVLDKVTLKYAKTYNAMVSYNSSLNMDGAILTHAGTYNIYCTYATLHFYGGTCSNAGSYGVFCGGAGLYMDTATISDNTAGGIMAIQSQVGFSGGTLSGNAIAALLTTNSSILVTDAILNTNTVGLIADASSSIIGLPASGTNLALAETTQAEGWKDCYETWTYASATTFTITGNYTYKYSIGMKLKWTQGTTIYYGYVVACSYGAPNTTVTVAGNAVLNDTILSPVYSTHSNPYGFTHWFDRTPVISSTAGTITSYTILSAKYKISGREITENIRVQITNNGTGSGGLSVTTARNAVTENSDITGRETASTGKSLQGVCQTGGAAIIYTYDNSYPAGTNYVLNITIKYEI